MKKFFKIFLLILTLLCFTLAYLLVIVRSTITNKRNSELLIAIKSGDSIKVKSLLEEGADPNAEDEEKQAAITLVAEAPIILTINATRVDGSPARLVKRLNYAEIVQLLVSKGANVNVKSKDGVSPLDQARSMEESQTVDLLSKLPR